MSFTYMFMEGAKIKCVVPSLAAFVLASDPTYSSRRRRSRCGRRCAIMCILDVQSFNHIEKSMND